MPQNMLERNCKIVGNWKMHGEPAALDMLTTIQQELEAHAAIRRCVDVTVCLPATLLALAQQMPLPDIRLGAQACHDASEGAQTGQLSAMQLGGVGAQTILCGHSETRANAHLDDAAVAARAYAVWDAGLRAIICIGESQSAYESGQTAEVLVHQLRASLGDKASQATPQNCWLAYEPIWAIGSGRIPDMQEIADVHLRLREALKTLLGTKAASIPLLYGGSVNGKNAGDILACPDVDGVLVGGASLRSADFLPIITAGARRTSTAS